MLERPLFAHPAARNRALSVRFAPALRFGGNQQNTRRSRPGNSEVHRRMWESRLCCYKVCRHELTVTKPNQPSLTRPLPSYSISLLISQSTLFPNLPKASDQPVWMSFPGRVRIRMTVQGKGFSDDAPDYMASRRGCDEDCQREAIAVAHGRR